MGLTGAINLTIPHGPLLCPYLQNGMQTKSPDNRGLEWSSYGQMFVSYNNV